MRPDTVQRCHTDANILLAHWHYFKGSQSLGQGAGDFGTIAELDTA